MSRSIALAGKGGTGKTTIAALLISQLCAQDMKPVLAIDADADANLGTLLGIAGNETLGELREDALKKVKNLPAGMTKQSYFELGLHEIVAESEGFDLITMGRGEGAGCYCYLNSLIRKFIDDLSPSYKWVIMDNEAGLEHISRRTTKDIDALIVVVTDNPLSYNSAQNVQEILDDIGGRIRKKYLVTNLIKDDNRRKKIVERLGKINMEYLCDVPFDAKLDDVIFNGESLMNLKDSPAVESIKYILERIGEDNGNS
jgi:CO dehydrogenase maturation factor